MRQHVVLGPEVTASAGAEKRYFQDFRCRPIRDRRPCPTGPSSLHGPGIT